MGLFTASFSKNASLSGSQPNKCATRLREASNPIKTLKSSNPFTLLKIIAGPIRVGLLTVPPAPTKR